LLKVGERFLSALAARDFPELRASVADDVRFRLLVPKGPQAHAGAEETLSRFTGWFGDADELRLEAASASTVADRLVVTYRVRLRNGDRWRLIEQHLVADARPDGCLQSMDLLCSGFHAT
jgi:hypothetical protein